MPSQSLWTKSWPSEPSNTHFNWYLTDSLAEERNKLQADLESSTALLGTTRSELDANNERLSTLQSELDALRSASSENESALTVAKNAQTDLEVRLGELESAKNHAEQQLETLRAENEKLEKEIADGAQEAEQSMVGQNDLNDKIKELESSLEAALKELAEARETLSTESTKWTGETEVRRFRIHSVTAHNRPWPRISRRRSKMRKRQQKLSKRH